MAAWKECLLGDVLNLKRGYDLPHSARSPGPFPVVSSSGITDHHREARASGPGVVTGRYGTLGQVFFVETDYWPLNTSLYVQDFKGNDPRFISYFLRTLNLKSQNAAGAVPGVNRNHLHALSVRIPHLKVQQRIAGILSSYDELIENNRRRIEILEVMARVLYREWFVHFRFPGHEDHACVASPLGEIPVGWRVVNLDSMKAQQPHAINGGPFGSKLVSKDYIEEGVPVIRGSNLSESGRFDPNEFVFVSSEKAEELRANLAKPGDIVVTQRGTLGQIGMIPFGIGYDQFVISQSQMKVTLDPKKVNREFAFFFLRSEEVNQRIKNLASSSGVPHINLAVLREFQILIPPFELQSKFGHFALSTEAAIEALLRQLQNLRRTRDLLLPRLFSGQVEVEAA
jgi:type I restriction enzyme, S subunit